MDKVCQEIVLRKAISNYGKRMQIIVAIEELSELQKELCKMLRGKMNIDHVVEEMADVEIMLRQLKMMICRDYDIERKINEKIERLEKRIIEGE